MIKIYDQYKKARSIQIMGILNTTPDSFFDGGNYTKIESALKRAEDMISQGVDVIDIGGESSRPGSKNVPLDIEFQRVIPLIEQVHKAWPHIPISIDTTKFEIAEAALEKGAVIINDISGARNDERMLQLAGNHQVKFIIMHMQGQPETMQKRPSYDNVIDEINAFFDERVKTFEKAGALPEQLILDPGIGFGKTIEHNYQILGSLDSFKQYELPILIGLSMKSLLGGDTKDRLPGTLALNVWSVLSGADVIRVHHVRETVLALHAIQTIFENKL